MVFVLRIALHLVMMQFMSTFSSVETCKLASNASIFYVALAWSASVLTKVDCINSKSCCLASKSACVVLANSLSTLGFFSLCVGNCDSIGLKN